MSSPEEMFNDLPRITKIWLVLAFGSTLATSVKLISAYKLVFLPDYIYEDLEIWRFITPFIFFGPFSFPFVMNLFFLVRYSGALEADPYCTTPAGITGSTSDYIFCLAFCAFITLIVAYFMEMMMLGPSLVFSILYLWSRRHPDDPISFWGFRFKGIHLPWVLTIFGILIGNSPVPDLVGIAVGHVYFFLVEVMPLRTGRNIINTPMWLIQGVDYITGEQTFIPRRGGFNQAPQQPAQYFGGAGNRDWGQGRALGTQQ